MVYWRLNIIIHNMQLTVKFVNKGEIKFDLHTCNVHLKINNLTVLANSEQR